MVQLSANQEVGGLAFWAADETRRPWLGPLLCTPSDSLGNLVVGSWTDEFVTGESRCYASILFQVMGRFKSCLGPWVLRLGNVKMTAAILELCEVPFPARAAVRHAFLQPKIVRSSLGIFVKPWGL